jgi:hypothetical protein
MSRTEEMPRATRFCSLKPQKAYTYETPECQNPKPMVKIMTLILLEPTSHIKWY